MSCVFLCEFSVVKPLTFWWTGPWQLIPACGYLLRLKMEGIFNYCTFFIWCLDPLGGRGLEIPLFGVALHSLFQCGCSLASTRDRCGWIRVRHLFGGSGSCPEGGRSQVLTSSPAFSLFLLFCPSLPLPLGASNSQFPSLFPSFLVSFPPHTHTHLFGWQVDFRFLCENQQLSICFLQPKLSCHLSFFVSVFVGMCQYLF